MPRRLVLILLAVLLSAGTFFLAQWWLHGQLTAHGAQAPAGAAASNEPPPAQVLVAAADLPVGSLITPADLRWQKWPGGDQASAYLIQGHAKMEDYVGAVTRQRLTAGEPLADGEVVKPGERGFLAAVLMPGMRAVTMNVTPNTGEAGFLQPGDHVDIILTSTVQRLDKNGKVDKDAPSHHVSETVLTDLRVVGVDQALSIDHKADNKALATGPVPPKTVSLELTPKQAEILTVSVDMGVLTLSLHSLGHPVGTVDNPKLGPMWDVDAAPGSMHNMPRDIPAAAVTGTERHLLVVRGGQAIDLVMRTGSQ